MKCPHCSSNETTWKSKAAKWECNACEERFEGIVCPKCASGDLIWKEKACKWECVSCEERFEPMPVARTPVLAETMPANALSVSPAGLEAASGSTKPKVFLSYGRRDAKDVAERLERDLEAAGYEVWMDVKKIGSGSMWQQEIENGLRKAQVVVSLLSPHAVRRVGESDAMDSVCLDELTFARTSSPPTPVVPVMVVPCEPPFIIYRLDYVHLTGWRDSEEDYRQGFERLVSGIRDALAGKVRYRAWEDRLRPLDFSDYMASKRRGFVGREWLFEEIDLWRFESEERALLITGDPGAGKSSIVAQLVHANPDGQVIGYHCCQSNEIDTLRPAKFVQSLAAMIASRIPAYAQQIEVPSVKEALEDKRCETDPGGAFLEGILHPLQKLPAPDEGVRYILVDALDEALGHTGATNIVDVLASRLERLPAWLRIMATTRNEPAVIQRLSGLRAKSIDASDPRNIKDLATYIGQRLQEPSLAERIVESRMSADAVVEILSLKSLGNFLYAVNALDGISRDFYSFANLDSLPRGLDGLYLDFFRRIFGRDGTEAGDTAYKKAKPLLQIMCTAAEPLSRVELADASGLDPDEELPRLLRQLAQLLSRRTRSNGEETIALYHKSIADWLTTNLDFNAFAVSPAKGRKLLAEFCRVALAHGRSKPGWYVRRHAVVHFLEVEDWDNATATLSDLEFVEARAIAQELSAMLKDFAEVVKLLPEGEKERQTEAARQAELDRYAKEMYEYSATFSRIRDGSGEAEPSLPRPVETVRVWTEDEIAAERKRITEAPNRLDIVKAFRVFVATNFTPLQRYAFQESFIFNHAINHAPCGPVAVCALKPSRQEKKLSILKRFKSSENGKILDPNTIVFDSEDNNTIWSVDVDPTGQLAVSGSNDGTIRVWDLKSLECSIVLRGHRRDIKTVKFIKAANLVVSGSSDETIRIWSLDTGECLKVLSGHEDIVNSIDFTPDGDHIISASSDKKIRVWDVHTGNCLGILEGHTDSVYSVLLTADGQHAMSSSCDGTIRVWDLNVLKCVKVYEGYADTFWMTPLAISMDAKRWVFSGSRRFDSGGALIVIDGRLNPLVGHIGSVIALAITPDGRRIASAGFDRTIRIWDVEKNECIRVFSGHKGAIYSISITPDGRNIISVGDDGTVRVWDARFGDSNIHEKHTGLVNKIGIMPSAEIAVTASDDHTLRIWEIDSGKCLKVLEGHTESVISLVLSQDGKRIISGSRDKTLRIWDVESGECLKVLKGHKGSVNCLVLSKDGKRIISGSDTKTLRVWDLESGKCLKALKDIGSVKCLVLCADGKRVISGNANTIRVWDVESGECLKVLKGNVESVDSLVLCADGRRVVSGIGDNILSVWDIESGERLHILTGHNKSISALGVTPDGRRIVSGSSDMNLVVWDIESGDRLWTFEGHSHKINSLYITEDGAQLISFSEDCLIISWDLRTGLRNGVTFTRSLYASALGTKNKNIVIGAHDGSVDFFNLAPPLGPFITTAHREILSEDLPAGLVTARPPCCGQKISISNSIADRIDYWAIEAADGECGYTDPDLLLDCPNCGTPLRMNPFFVDVKK